MKYKFKCSELTHYRPYLLVPHGPHDPKRPLHLVPTEQRYDC